MYFEASSNLNRYWLICSDNTLIDKYLMNFFHLTMHQWEFFFPQTRGELTAALPALRLRLCCKRKPSAEMRENVKSWPTRSTAWRGVWLQQTQKRGSRRSADIFISLSISVQTLRPTLRSPLDIRSVSCDLDKYIFYKMECTGPVLY